MILVLCGKSATGKDSVAKALVSSFGYHNIVSTTSRPKREKEVDGVDYHFKSRSEFETLIIKGKMIEYRAYNTLVGGKPDIWYYGVADQNFSKEENYVCVLDPGGLRNLKKAKPDQQIVSICLETPEDIRELRARRRGSFDATEWERRKADDERVFWEAKSEGLFTEVIRNESETSIGEICEKIQQTIIGENPHKKTA